MWDKHSNFETSTRVPMVIRVPGQRAGRTDGLVELVDIYPTLCELCDLPLPEGLEGTSFAPLVADPDGPWKDPSLSQYPRIIPGYGPGMGRSIRTRRYRYTEWTVPDTQFFAAELYDHARDPGENINVAGKSEFREVTDRLSRRLHDRWQSAHADR